MASPCPLGHWGAVGIHHSVAPLVSINFLTSGVEPHIGSQPKGIFCKGFQSSTESMACRSTYLAADILDSQNQRR